MPVFLKGTVDVVRVTTDAAANVLAHADFVDATAAGVVLPPGDRTNTAAITTATTATVVAAPGSGTTRNLRQLTVANTHATVATNVLIEHYDGTTASQLWEGRLLAGESVVLDAFGRWTLYGTDGIAKTVGVLTALVLGKVGDAAQAASDADTLKVFARKVAGRMTLKTIGPYGIDQVMQDKMSENGFVLYLPNSSTTVGLNLGLGWTSGGTVSHPTPSSTSPAIYNQQKRTRWANVVTTTNQILGLRTATAEKRFWRGNAAGLGGWNFHARFAIGLWPAATVRLFVGLNDSNAGWVISDTLTGNGCGLWHDTTEAATVLNFVTRGGTTATKAAITLATALAAGQCFDFWMYCPPNGSSIGYRLVELNTGSVLVDTTTNVTLPLTTAFLGPELAMSNGTANITVTTTAFELAGHSIQSDN